MNEDVMYFLLKRFPRNVLENISNLFFILSFLHHLCLVQTILFNFLSD